jgi:hypothetical protein
MQMDKEVCSTLSYASTERNNTMKLKSIASALVAVAVLSSVALAASPHFIGTPTSTFSGGALTVSGQIAGLGNQEVTIVLSATVVSYCTNNGGNIPPGLTETLSATLTDLHPENGNLSFSITTGKITAKCPGNQKPTTTVTSATLKVYQGGKLVLTQTF